MSHKVSYALKIIDPVINGFIPNDVSIHFHICDHSIITFGIRECVLWLSNTFHVENLDGFIKLVVYNVKKDICV